MNANTSSDLLKVSILEDENDGDFSAGDLSLREAIALANQESGVDTITFDESLNGAIVLNAGQLEITDALVITGTGADKIQIDGNGSDRLFKIDDGDSETAIDVAIDGLTITNGNVGDRETDNSGGGILNLENLFLFNSKVTGNTAEEGGGIANQGSVTIENSELDSNIAVIGAGLHSTSGFNQIIDSQVTQNEASVSHGGIYGDSLFIEVKNSNITDNIAEELAGGLGVSNALANIIDSSITGNSSSGDGGGIAATSATTNIDNSAIADNSAASGGGILVNASGVTVNNSTIAGNEASTGNGGGVSNGLGSLVELNNSTIALNSAAIAGAGVYQQQSIVAEDGSVTAGTINLNSTIVADNIDDLDLGGDVVNSQGNNLIGNGDNSGIANSTVTDAIGTADNPLDPRLGSLQDNGGETQTIELLIDSPAIDAGSNPNDLATDQRGTGFDRTIGNGTDIGAFEVQTPVETEDPVDIPNELVVSTLEDEADGDFSAGDLSLREAIALANQKEGIDDITFESSLNGSIVLSLGQIEITEGVAVLGNGAENLTIDGNNSDRLFYIDDDNEDPTDVAFNSLTLSNGNVTGRDADNSGGAIFNKENLFIFNSVITNSQAEQGGAIANQGSVVVQNSSLENNSAAIGGGLYSTSGFNQFVDSTISNNSASFTDGGIHADSLFLEIKNSIIENNTAGASVGGIGVTNSLANIDNSQIRNNSAESNTGGFSATFSETNVTNSTISGNSAATTGGIALNSSTAKIGNSTIFGNSATVNEGGGINSSAASTTTVTNTTIAGNSAAGDGAGIYREPAFSNEDGEVVDGIFNLTSSLVADNIENKDVSGGVITSGGNNLIGNGDRVAGVFDLALGDLVGTTDNPLDPKLGELGDNGGTTPTVALLPGSVAIDAGSNPNELATDQRGSGFDRTIGAGTDIGAFEVQNIEEPPLIDPNLLTVSTLEDENDGDFNPGDLSLREAIALASSGATITFDSSLSGGTIVLNSGELTIDRSLSINGLGANNLSISGANKSRTFRVDNGDFDTDADVVIDGLTIKDAEGFGDGSLGLDGGAFFNQENLTLRNVSLTNNSAVNGGAVFNQGSLLLENSLVAENFGGTAPILNNGGTVTVANTTITNNATGGVGAIDNTLGSELNLSNSTITDNNGFDAAVAVGGSNATIVSTIIARNSGSADPTRDDVIGEFNSNGNNLIGNGNGGSGFGAAGDLIGTADNPLDPQLEPLQNNGGAIFTRALPADSIALDTGSNPNNLTADGRGEGFDRTIGNGTDIGAFELQTIVTPTPITNPTDGDDEILGTQAGDRLSGLSGNDTIEGMEGNDTLFGDNGNDSLQGDAGNDSLDGGTGNDTLAGSEGNDTLFGNNGEDSLDGGAGRDSLDGGTGNDTLAGAGGNDTLFGNNGEDSLDGGAGRDSLDGGTGSDTLFGTGGNDTLFGNNGEDLIDGGTGRDSLDGGTGNDTLFGLKGNDTLFGNNGDDLIDGRSGNDSLDGGTGSDTLFGLEGNDTLFGNNGEDLIDGGTGRDSLDGGTGNDRLFGREENDTLFGNNGNDSLFGGDGDDLIDGGIGNDELRGEAGNDTFVLTPGSADTISDFDLGNDLLGLSAGISFADLSFAGDDIIFNDAALVSLSGLETNSLNESNFVNL